MGYEIGWLIEGRVLYAEFSGTLNRDDVDGIDNTIIGYLESGTGALVHCIVELSGMEKPMSLNLQSQFNFMRHPRMGWLTVIGNASRLIRITAKIVSQMFKARFREVNSYEEALQFLQFVDATLPDLHEYNVRR